MTIFQFLSGSTARVAPFLLIAGLPAWCQQARASSAEAAKPDPRIVSHFFALADIAAKAMMPEPADQANHRKTPGMRDYHMFFVDSYAMRALAVAYDLTGRERYWEACRTWSDRMVRHQQGMIPAGAYYMNYGRKPGETKGQWFVADSGSIAMAVLATAARAKDPALRKRYLDSVRAYLSLTKENYIRESGGVTDGIFDKWDKEWWCSSALYAAAALQYYGLTGEAEYRRTGLRAVDWLTRFEYSDTTDLYRFEVGAPTTIFYVLEACSSALPYLTRGSVLQRRVFEKYSQTVEWIAANQTRQGTWDYNPDNWGVKLGGFPSQLLIYLNNVGDTTAKQRKCISPAGRTVSFEEIVRGATERALDHFASLPLNPAKFTQKDAFVLMSEAELLCPGELYHKRTWACRCRPLTGQELGAAQGR